MKCLLLISGIYELRSCFFCFVKRFIYYVNVCHVLNYQTKYYCTHILVFPFFFLFLSFFSFVVVAVATVGVCFSEVFGFDLF